MSLDYGFGTMTATTFQYQRILSVCSAYGEKVKIIILKCPYYSINIYNTYLGTAGSNPSKDCDKQLKDKIDCLNLHIRQINDSNNLKAPKFSVVLIKTRKSNKSRKVKTISYSLLKDGIHSGFILSRYWLRRIINTVLAEYCY